jgi:hypothetical protein
MKKTNLSVTIDVEIYEEARRKGINISSAAEAGIAAASGQSIKIVHKRTKVDDLTDSTDENFKEMIKNVVERPGSGVGSAVKIIKRIQGIALSLKEAEEFYERIKEGKP